MASPFRMFRRHQKLWMAVLTVGAMIAFVFLGQAGLIDSFSRSGGKDPVRVRTTKFGNLTLWQLQNKVQNRRRLNGFATDVAKAVYQSGGKTAVAGGLLRMTRLPSNQDELEKATVDTWLMAQEAQRVGQVVSDDDVRTYLNALTDGKIPVEDLGQFFRGGEMTDKGLFILLKEVLAAERYEQLMHVSLEAFPPAVLWDYFCRLNRRARAEVAAVPVAQYAGKVPAPTNEEVEAFFEKYKSRYPHAASPEPGFRVPKRLAVQYFAVNLEKFADPKAITDAEIDKEYEAHKEAYDRDEKRLTIDAEPKKAVTEPKKANAELTEQQKKAAAGKKSEPEKKTDAGKKADAGKKTEPEKKADAGKKAEPEKQPVAGGAAAESEPPKAADKAGQPPTETKSKKGPEEKSPAATKSPDKTSSLGASPFRLVALADEKKPADGKQAPAGKKPAEGKKAAEGKKPAETTKKAVEPLEPVTPERPVSPEEAKAAKEAAEAKAAKAAKAAEAKAAKEAEEARMKRIKEAVRKRLALGKAWEKIDTIFVGLEDLMNEYQRRKVRYDNPGPRTVEHVPPAPLDFAALAKKYGLTSGQTKLVSDTEISPYDIANSIIENGTPFREYAYQTLVTLKPTRSADRTSRYLFWLADETEARIPKLDDPGVRAAVIEEWKMVQAREIARKAAEKLAAEARRAGKPLKTVLADFHVTKTDSFSWMTYGSVPADASMSPPKLSEVEGVDMPGEAFMRTVFGLKKGEIGVAMNQPQTVAYVVKVIEFAPPPRLLMDLFETTSPERYLDVARPDLRETFLAQRKEFRAAAGLKWEPRPKADTTEGAPAPQPEPDEDD